jgi:hypothetical protein
MYSSTLALTSALEVGGQRHAPAALPPGSDPVPIVQQSGWDPGTFWAGVVDLALPKTDPWTFQQVASPYIDYAIPAPYLELGDQSSRNCTVLSKSFRI